MQKLLSWKMFWLAAVVLLPTVAFAQDSLFGSGNISPSDVSIQQFLNPLFGGLLNQGGGSNPLEELLKTFNKAVLIVGGILVFYTIVAGTLSTAHDGEMLGKRWSSMWIPIRTTLGAVAITPVLGASSGYCLIQALVMWLAVQGVSLANGMWAVFLTNQNPVAEAFYSPPGASRQIREVFNGMFLSNVCTSGFAQSQSLIGSALAKTILKPITATVTPLTWAGKPMGYTYGPMVTLCGKVTLSDRDSASAEGTGGPATASALVDAGKLNDALRSVHESHMAAAQATLKTMADQLVQNNLDEATFAAQMNNMVQSYTADLKTKAQQEYASQRADIQTKLIDGMTKDGWALAGIYYMAIVRAQDEITRSITQTPSVASGELNGSGHFADDMAKQGITGALGNAAVNAYIGGGERSQYLTAANEMIRASNAGATNQAEAIGDAATQGSWVMRVVGWFMNDDMTFMGNSQFAQQGQNPIIMAKNLGDNMTAGAWTALGIGGSALALTGVGAGIAGAWATVFTPVLFALFAMFVVPGAVLSVYVPMIPYILWTGVVIGWVLLVIEAVIASPLWALSHLAPDGDGIVGRGGQGYMLILSLTLRPALMIMGLASSIALMKPVGYFINSTFMGAFAIGVNPGTFGITAAIAGCVIYTMVMVSVIHRVFSLIHWIPDHILRWIGGGGNELGEQAHALEGMTSGSMRAAMMATTQIGQLTGSVGQGMRDLSAKKANQENATKIQGEESRSRMAQQEANDNDIGYRAGKDAQTASSKAEGNPTDSGARQNAAMSNEMARDARMQEASGKVDNYMRQSGVPALSNGIAGLRSMPLSKRQEMANDMRESNPEAAQAVDFANNMDKASFDQAADPNSGAMKDFLSSAVGHVSQNGSSSKSWQVAAAKGLSFEQERQKWSSPVPPSGGGGDGQTPDREV